MHYVSNVQEEDIENIFFTNTDSIAVFLVIFETMQ